MSGSRHAALLAGALSAVLLPADAVAARCRAPEGASVQSRTTAVVIYTRSSQQDSLNTRRDIWGCLRSRGRLVSIRGERSSESSLRTVSRLLRVRGRFVATVSEDTFRGSGSSSINVVDLRSGKARRRNVGLLVPNAEVPPLRVTHLVLTAGGVAAWRQAGEPSPGQPPNDRVRVTDGRTVRSLDQGAFGSITELAIERDRVVRWLHAGAPRRWRVT